MTLLLLTQFFILMCVQPTDCQHGAQPQTLLISRPFGLIAEIRLICLPASGTRLSRWPSNDITECLRQAQEKPRGQEMRKTENDSLN